MKTRNTIRFLVATPALLSLVIGCMGSVGPGKEGMGAGGDNGNREHRAPIGEREIEGRNHHHGAARDCDVTRTRGSRKYIRMAMP